jgi:allantoinase
MRESFDFIIRARRVLLPAGEAGCAVAVRDGRVEALESRGSRLSAARELELADDVVVMPGLVDSHVHICEPGNTEWEGFATATRAAAAGGITTLVDMPLDSIPTTVDVAALEIKQKAAGGKIHVDVAFWGGLIPGNLDQLEPMWRAGVVGFKCFLIDSGSPDFPPVDAATMEAGLRVAGGLGIPLIVHAESAEVAAGLETVQGSRYADYLGSRPRGLENLAIAQLIEAARRTGGNAHVCHLSSSDALPMITSARREGVGLSAETCPHYLTLCAEEISDGKTIAKCSPPIREAANRELLWEGLRAQALDLVVSDHSPCTPDMKTAGGGNFAAAWGGVSSLQYALPLVWSGARSRGFSLGDVAKWMSAGPAKLAGLHAKGSIAVGQDADFCIFAPDETFVVDPAECHHRNPGTPYDGRTLSGVVRSTILRGERVDGALTRGRLLTRSP